MNYSQSSSSSSFGIGLAPLPHISYAQAKANLHGHNVANARVVSKGNLDVNVNDWTQRGSSTFSKSMSGKINNIKQVAMKSEQYGSSSSFGIGYNLFLGPSINYSQSTTHNGHTTGWGIGYNAFKGPSVSFSQSYSNNGRASGYNGGLSMFGPKVDGFINQKTDNPYQTAQNPEFIAGLSDLTIGNAQAISISGNIDVKNYIDNSGLKAASNNDIAFGFNKGFSISPSHPRFNAGNIDLSTAKDLKMNAPNNPDCNSFNKPNMTLPKTVKIPELDNLCQAIENTEIQLQNEINSKKYLMELSEFTLSECDSKDIQNLITMPLIQTRQTPNIVAQMFHLY